MAIYSPPTINAVQKTLGAQLLSGVTSAATLNNVVGIPNEPGIMVVDRVDSSGNSTASLREYIAYTGTSGSTVTGLTRNVDNSGTDQDHAVGAVVEFVFDVVQAKAIKDTFETEHNADGTHDTTKVVDLTTAQTLTNKTLTSPVINGAITGDAIATGATINTGTANDDIVTSKAIADSRLGFLTNAQSGCWILKSATTQTVATATETKIQFDNESYDLGGEFDPTTNYRFTSTNGGFYIISLSIYFNSVVNTITLSTKRNGNIVGQTSISPATVNYQTAGTTHIVRLTAGQYLEFYVTHTKGSDANIWHGAGTYVGIQKLASL